MNVTATRLDDTPVEIGMGVPDFLQGPVMTHLAALNNDCEPVEILRDYLPSDLDAMDDEGLSQAIEEACVMALNVDTAPGDVIAFLTVDRVKVEPEDLPALKHAFGIKNGLQLVPPSVIAFPQPLWAA